MARKPTPPKREDKELGPDEQRAAVARLETRIKELRELDVSNLHTGDDPPVQDLEQRIRSTLASIYGENSRQYFRLEAAASLDATIYVMNLGFGHRGGGTGVAEIRDGVNRGRARAISILQGEVDALKETLQFSDASVTVLAIAGRDTAPVELSEEIFIVHGRDEAAKEAVARVIQNAGLKPVILHEQPNGGKTIIEKFEKHGSAVGFAVVIATPDDVGGFATDPSDRKPRARQNVIGEMFWFAGRLGRDKVCALVKGTIDMPTDFAGVVYTPMDDHGGWKGKLLQELNAAGYTKLNWPEAMK